jgi:hypothetical protein
MNNDFLKTEISVFDSIYSNKGKLLSLDKFLFPDNFWKKKVLDTRKQKSVNPSLFSSKKKQLRAATISGVFENGHSVDHLRKHSGLICIDIDKLNSEELVKHKENLSKLEFVAYAGLSVSGNGLFAIIPIQYPDKHKEHFSALKQYFRKLNIQIDSACSDISRLRFQSYDADPIVNESPQLFTDLGQLEIKRKIPDLNHSSNEDSLERLIATIQKKNINITQNYDDWIKIGYALVSYGEKGKEYFHRLSSLDTRYNPIETEKTFKKLCMTNKNKISLGTLFHIAKEHGVYN